LSERIAVNVRQYAPENTPVIGLLSDPGTGDLLFAMGPIVPTISDAGYVKGCIFLHLNASSPACPVYVNVGTAKDCDFKLLALA
jgi:hypothetical protein